MTTTSLPNSWITCYKPNSKACLRLFCFPHAGGGALSFRSWSNDLPPTVEVCPIELPGRGIRFMETPLTQLDLLVRSLAEAILPYLDKPFVFFGHSMGALLSFELARWLFKAYNITTLHLFISACHAPQIPSAKPPIHSLPEAEFIEEMRRLNGTPKAVLEDREMMQILLPILRADFAVVETYAYTTDLPLKCPITAFGGLSDRVVSCDRLEAWREQTCASFTLHMLPGDHFFWQSSEQIFLRIFSRKLYQITTHI